MTFYSRLASAATSFALLFLGQISLGAQPRMVLPSDCVTVRYLSKEADHSSIALNSQGTRVAYIIKAPNLATNRNDFQLYVSDIRGEGSTSRKLALASEGISQPRWLSDGRHLVVISHAGSSSTVTQLDVVTGARTNLVQIHFNIREYSIDQDGKVLVYATDERDAANSALSKEESASGFRVPFQRSTISEFHRSRVFVSRRTTKGEWTAAVPITVHSPFSGRAVTSLPYAGDSYLDLSLAPDGSRILLTYMTSDALPLAWRQTPFLRRLESAGFGAAPVLVLYDLRSHKTTLPLKTPRTYGMALWSPDSDAFVVKADAPVSDPSIAGGTHTPEGQPDSIQVLWVRVEGDAIEQAIPQANFRTQPLAWSRDGDLLVRTAANSIATLARRDTGWRTKQSISIPLTNPYAFSQLASDGRRVVGDYQTTMTPPEIFIYDPAQSGIVTLAKLNPQVQGLTFAPAQSIGWTTSDGYAIHGLLLVPPDYRAGVRYPLVIQTKPEEGQFLCDTGESHYPSFAPQPLANAGILYLIRSSSAESDVSHYPLGYPGGIGEAAFQLDLWERAINSLDQQGIVDPSRIGIIGFSHSGWYTEYILAHSKVSYKAATVADNVEYSLGEYWLTHYENVLQGWDAMYGGPPYGATLANWLKYSISFNLDSIHTPILMEDMGYGIPYDERALPIGLAEHYEVFTGLNRLKRPVELYYYPHEGHQPETPRARLASLQRNLDWYRFWLLGELRDNPEDPDQYRRWQKLRDLQEHVDTIPKRDK